jgi:hypothetical protein
MHKSIIIFLALLVILLPLGNSLNISNAYAIADFDKGDRKQQVSVNSLKCINDNVDINGVNSGDIKIGNKGVTEGNLGAYSLDNGEGYYNDYKKAFDCSISNKNTNTNIISIGGTGNQTIPPSPPPEPTTATLTVKKQVFGCNTFTSPSVMDCTALRNDSTAWIDCNNIRSFSNPIFCQSLPESIFDIQVLDDQNTQIQQFVGSTEGTTIPNLEPGTYTVNEIKSPTSITDQLGVNPDVEAACINAGFVDGGRIDNSTAGTAYSICFEYEDEQDNDCSTITLAAGEERTCIVKNYIFSAVEGIDIP